MKKSTGLYSAVLVLLAAIFFTFSAFAAESRKVYCCMGEKISISKKDNETFQFDKEYLRLNKDNSFTALKDGKTVITLLSGESTDTPKADEKVTEAAKTQKSTETEKPKRSVVTEKITVRISKPVEKITLNKSKLTLGRTETFSLKYKLTKNTRCNSVFFRSTDPKIVKVDQDGNLTAKRLGKAKIVVQTSNGKKAVCRITVLKAPRKVTLNRKEIELGAGEKFKLKATLSQGSASYTKSFSTADKKTATVDSNGVLTARKKGKTTVKLKTHNGKTAVCTVTVKYRPKRIRLNETSLTLGKGESFRFSYSLSRGSAANSVKFSVSDEKIASITKHGRLTAKRTGKVTVSAVTYNGHKAVCKVRIKKAPSRIFAAEDSINVHIGKKLTPEIYFGSNAFSNKLTFTSSDSSVVAVEKSGRLWAKKVGSARITAESFNKKTCSFTVYVNSMGVPYVSQLPKYPTGCEAAAATSLLRYYGYDISLDQMIDTIPSQNVVTINGRRYGPSIYEKFVGDPRKYYNSASPGYGAFSPCVTKALQKAINARGGYHKAVLLTGCKWKDVLNEISLGRPAIVWSTYQMLVPSTVNSWYIKQPNGTYKYFEYPKGTHVSVLIGYSDNYVTTMDPIDGFRTFNINTFIDRWNLLGNQAIVLRKAN